MPFSPRASGFVSLPLSEGFHRPCRNQSIFCFGPLSTQSPCVRPALITRPKNEKTTSNFLGHKLLLKRRLCFLPRAQNPQDLRHNTKCEGGLGTTASVDTREKPARTFSITRKDLIPVTETLSLNALAKLGGVAGLAKKLGTDLTGGLSESEELSGFTSRKAEFGTNTYPEPPTRSVWGFFAEAFEDLTVRILIGAAGLSLALGLFGDGLDRATQVDTCASTATYLTQELGAGVPGWVDGVSILVAVMIVATVTAANNFSKEKQFQSLNRVKNNRPAKVVRHGRTKQLSMFDVQVGDVVLLDSGDHVPADGVFIVGFNLETDESAISGESASVPKDADHPFLLSGSQVTSGQGSMLVLAVGEHSEWGRTLAKLSLAQNDPTPLQQKLQGAATTIGAVGVGAAVLTVGALASRWATELWECGTPISSAVLWPLVDFFITGVTIVVMAVPEGLPLAVTISLAYSMRRMLEDKNLVRNLAACETMGGATNICSDKTGTLTENKMTAVECEMGGRYYPTIPSADDVPAPVLDVLIEGFSVNSNAYLNPLPDGRIEFLGNKTECALLMLIGQLGGDYQATRTAAKISAVRAFSSDTKRMSVIIQKFAVPALDRPEGTDQDRQTAPIHSTNGNGNGASSSNNGKRKGEAQTNGAADGLSSTTTTTTTSSGSGGTSAKNGSNGRRVPPMAGPSTSGVAVDATPDATITTNRSSHTNGTTVATATNGSSTPPTPVPSGVASISAEASMTSGGGGGATPVPTSPSSSVDTAAVEGRSSASAMCDPATRLDTHTFVRLYTKGAPEQVLQLCTRALDEGGAVVEMTQDRSRAIAQEIDDMNSKGLRTLILAYRNFEIEKWRGWEQTPCEDMTYAALVGIKDPVRAEVPAAVEECKKAGITVRMVTGDNVGTASHIARECGILTPDGTVLSGAEFRSLPSDKLRAVLPSLQVLARATPSDKFDLVKMLRQQGEVVAVTGDGTNDAPALKEADVGLSMGISGTEVAKEASDIVLMDDNFTSIVNAVMWGRCVYDNIRKFVQFQLTVNVTALVISFVSALGSMGRPLKPIQLLWVNMIMDTLGALALGTERPTRSLLNRKPYGRNEGLISGTMARNIIGQSLYQLIVTFFLLINGPDLFQGVIESHYLPLYADTFGPEYVASLVTNTVVFNTFVLCQVANEFNCRKLQDDESNVFEGLFGNPLFFYIIALTVAAQVGIVEYGGVWFDTLPLTPELWLISIAAGCFTIPWAFLLRQVPVPSALDRLTRSRSNDPWEE